MVTQFSAKVGIQTQVCLSIQFMMFLLYHQKLVLVDFCESNIYNKNR